MANEHYGKTNEASTTPNNFFAGDFPTLTETGTAGAAIAKYAPVCKNSDGEIVTIAAATKANVIGIAAEAAGEDEPVVFYQTGEFFADALAMPDGVTTGDIADTLRGLSIFLRGDIDAPTPAVTPSVELDKSTVTVAAEATTTLTATTTPAGETVTWTSSDSTKATVAAGVVTGVAAGSATITASITVDGESYTDTCAVTVTAE